MITTYGYISTGLDRLSVEGLEEVLRDMYLNSFGLHEFRPSRLRREYIAELQWRYNSQIEFTHEFERLLHNANEVLIRDSAEVIREAYDIYQKCKQSLSNESMLNQFHIEVDLKLPLITDYDVERKIDCQNAEVIDKDLWNAFAESINSEYGYGVIPFLRFDKFSKVEDLIQYALWGTISNNMSSWAHGCGLPEHIMHGKYFYCWPFHDIISHCDFPLKWLVLIKEYDYEIKVEYSNER